MIPSRMTFITCLLGAPVIFGAITGLFGLGGEYLGRFAFVGRVGLLLCLPAWLTLYAWLAWRAAKRGETGIRPYIFAALGANIGSLIAYPLMIFAGEAMGGEMSAKLRASVQVTTETADAADLPLVTAALFAGAIVFFLGLFFLPVMAALFGWLAGMLGLVKGANSR